MATRGIDPIAILAIRKRGTDGSVMSALSERRCGLRARVSSPRADRELRYFGEVEITLCH